MASNTTRRGQFQGQGQLIARAAKKHGRSVEWITLIGFGSLEDPAFVAAALEAESRPELWEMVSPDAKNKLIVLNAKAGALGRSERDVLEMFAEAHVIRSHPRNRRYAAEHTAFALVELELDHALTQRMDADLQLARRLRAAPARLAEGRRRRASRAAKKLEQKVEKRRPGLSKEAVYRHIASAAGIKPASVKRRVMRHKKKPAD